jgi:hypothetical protein
MNRVGLDQKKSAHLPPMVSEKLHGGCYIP